MSLLIEDDLELALLGIEGTNAEDEATGEKHALKTAPIFTGDVLEIVGRDVFSQRAIYGIILDASSGVKRGSQVLYINSNAPFSGIICGVQGSGKSHSTSVFLESCLISDKRLGTLPEPLCGLMFHYDKAADAEGVSPCEAAYIASLDPTRGGQAIPPKVVVLVMPKYLNSMRKVYQKFPNVVVEPLHFSEEDINGERILSMMKVDQDHQMPLYMECIMSILRSMEKVTYREFLQQLEMQKSKFSSNQRAMLELRQSLLESFLQGGTPMNRVSTHFKKGQLTIIDLSSPFMDASSACGFFDIILGLFIEAKAEGSGKLVVLDEAHKYLTDSGSSSRLTESLLSIIRQQRHLGTRVLISTQEPTVVPSTFLDLCSFVIAHRFSSPRWMHHLKDHVSAVDEKWGLKVITLRTGEAMMFSPAGLVLRHSEGEGQEDNEPKVEPLGQGYLLVRSRERITVDGGRSILATECSKDLGNEINLHNPSFIESTREFDTMIPTLARAGSSRQTDPSGRNSPLSEWISPYTMPSTPRSLPQPSKPFSRVPLKSPPSVASTPKSPPPPPPPPPLTKTVLPPKIPTDLQPLVMLLQKSGHPMSFSDVGTQLKKKNPVPYVGKLKDYLGRAEKAGLVVTDVDGPETVTLSAIRTKERQVTCPPEYTPLVNIIRKLSSNGQAAMRSDVGSRLHQLGPQAIKTTFKEFIRRAEVAGVVVCPTKHTLAVASSIP